MKKRSEPKGGRKSARKAHRVARSKPDTHTSVLPSVAKIQRKESAAYILVRIDGLLTTYTIHGVQALHAAVRDALRFYDRVAGNILTDHGWTAGDVRRLDEIRKMVQPQ